MDARQRKVRQRIYREKPYKVMHVCMATDVDVETLRDKKPWDPSYFYTEHVLFSIKLYADGLMETMPEFSKPIEEEGGIGAELTSQSVFLSDKDVAAAIRKGFKLATYRVSSKLGSEFEYSFENINALVLPAQIEEARRREASMDAVAAANSRGTSRSSDPIAWKQDPPAQGYDKSVAVYAELVSGTGFEGERLYVNYQVTMPQGWSLRTGDLSDGLSGKDLKKKGGAGALMASMDGYASGKDAHGMLSGTTQTALAREARGGIHIPTLRPMWKGVHIPYVFDSFSRALWGYSFFILTVLAVILGVDYPFWLIPCFGFLYVVGTGYPGGPVQVLLLPKGKTGSGLHKTSAKRTLVGAQVTSPSATFNHLMNFSFDVKELDLASEANPSLPSSQAPTILFQVYSVGLFGRNILEGCGYVHMPSSSGAVDVMINTWKPIGGIGAQQRDYFLGSSARLKDPSFVEVPNKDHAPTALNRFGVRTETSGELRFRAHVAITDPRALIKQVDAQLEARTQIVPRRTIADILQDSSVFKSNPNLQRSLQSLASSTTSLAGGGGGGGGGGLADSTVIGRKAELLIAQAKAKLAASGKSSSLTPRSEGDFRPSSSFGDSSKMSLRDDDEGTLSPLLSTAEAKSSVGGASGGGGSAKVALAPLTAPQAKSSSRAGRTRYGNDDEQDLEQSEPLLR